MKPGNRLVYRNGANSHKVIILLLKMREKRFVVMLSLSFLKKRKHFLFVQIRWETQGGTV
ncbi:hypothetical protein RN70_10015 [Staphylococcus schleiferi]|nr:hypothetical protein NP71_09740 [Staphylococcus schleiferi]AKS71922.1 hypothetical protein OA96_09005 [Staphylococcus schleiferi]AKS74211.1 hypothetical protein RN70_10015 [Staphylococcus schleiferi]